MEDSEVIDSFIELYGGGVVGMFFNEFPEAIFLPLEEILPRLRISIRGQTELFRDSVVLHTFENIVLPNYPANQVVHIASVGCSDGREAYSLLLNNWNQKERLKIDAFDVDPERIETAIAGEYEINDKSKLEYLKSLNLANPGEVYEITGESKGIESIDHAGNGLEKKIQFNDGIKRRINFQVHDILKEPLSQKYDVVLLLNVLMHYAPKGRENILLNLYRSMNEGDWLLCEATNYDNPFPERREYFKWMEDIERLGFETIIQPTYTISSESRTAKTYRKMESLMV